MPTEILSGLWIGSIDDLKHPIFFEDMEINIIVNLTDCDFKVQKQNVSYINLPISSYNIYSMNNMIYKLVDNIHNNLLESSKNFRKENTVHVDSYEDLISALNGDPGFVTCFWDENSDDEDKVKAEKRRIGV